MKVYPVALELGGRLVVVVGGGRVAEQKVAGLLEVGARVRVVAASPSPALVERAARGEIEHLQRDYRDGDLEGAFLALAERLDVEILDALVAEAERRSVLLNVEDDPGRCSFLAQSVVRRGDLVVAISTSGKAPAMAVRLRQRLEAELGPAYARFLELAGAFRAPLLAGVPSFSERRRRWYRLVDSDALLLLARGEEQLAARRFAELLGVLPEPLAAAGGTGSRDWHGSTAGAEPLVEQRWTA